MQNLVVGQSLDGEVFAELPVGEVAPSQPLLPVAIGFDLIDEDGAMLTAVTCQVALSVAFQVQAPDKATAWHGLLPDRGVHDPTAPVDVARQPDVHRQ